MIKINNKVFTSFLIAFVCSILIAYNFFLIIPFFIITLLIKYKTDLNPSNIIAKTFAFLMLIAYPIIVYIFGTSTIVIFSSSEVVYKLDAVTAYFLQTFFIQFIAIACLILAIKDDLKQKKKS